MPAPVTTTILLLLATAKDKSLSVFLVDESTEGASRSRETVIVWRGVTAGGWFANNPSDASNHVPSECGISRLARFILDSMAKKYTDDQAQL